jgi:hypothetical protein
MQDCLHLSANLSKKSGTGAEKQASASRLATRGFGFDARITLRFRGFRTSGALQVATRCEARRTRLLFTLARRFQQALRDPIGRLPSFPGHYYDQHIAGNALVSVRLSMKLRLMAIVRGCLDRSICQRTVENMKHWRPRLSLAQRASQVLAAPQGFSPL